MYHHLILFSIFSTPWYQQMPSLSGDAEWHLFGTLLFADSPGGDRITSL